MGFLFWLITHARVKKGYNKKGYVKDEATEH